MPEDLSTTNAASSAADAPMGGATTQDTPTDAAGLETGTPADASTQATAAGGDAAQAQDGETLPWHKDPRFVNDLNKLKEYDTLQQQINEYRAFDPVIQELKKQNLNDADSVFGYLSRQEAEQQQAQEFQTRSQAVADELNGLINEGAISQEVGERLYAERLKGIQGELLGMQAQQILRANQEMTVGRELEAATKQYPLAAKVMDQRELLDLARATNRPISDVAKAIHDRAQAERTSAVAEYNAQQAAARRSPPIEGARGQSPSLTSDLPDPSDPGFRAALDKQIELAQARRAGYG